MLETGKALSRILCSWNRYKYFGTKPSQPLGNVLDMTSQEVKTILMCYYVFCLQLRLRQIFFIYQMLVRSTSFNKSCLECMLFASDPCIW